MLSSSVNKDKKIDGNILSTSRSSGTSTSSSNKKRNMEPLVSSSSKLKKINTNSKNIKASKVEEELCDDNFYDSSELSEEEYVYKK
jgi:hypothetical protein